MLLSKRFKWPQSIRIFKTELIAVRIKRKYYIYGIEQNSSEEQGDIRNEMYNISVSIVTMEKCPDTIN